MLVTEKSNFTRGDKASVSVRLRSKKTSEAVTKKRNRHSGDFSFFKHQNQPVTTAPPPMEDEQKEGGDWAYITFQNGVPTVQDIKTNVGPVSAREPVVVNGATPTPRPVKVINHQMPQIWQPQPQNKRMSGDFSMFAPPIFQAPPISRQATPAAMALRQQQHQSPSRRSPKKSPPSNNVTKVLVQPRPQVMYRRRSDHNQNGGVALHSGAAKRCSGEFDLGRGNRRSSSDYSLLMQGSAPPIDEAPPPSVVRVQCNYNGSGGSRPKSMIFSGHSPDIVRGTPIRDEVPRPPGLGRRAVTQINIKRNSYSSAMCKSQENLVKANLENEDGGSKEDILEEESKATPIRKGLLWQQRDKLFSQWKERYFILTSDYLQCFKKGSSKTQEHSLLMGEFIFKIKLCDVEDVDLLDRRGYLVISITLSSRGEGKIYLRKTEGIRDWFNSLKECVRDSKRRRSDRVNNSFWSSKQLTDSSSIEKWLLARKKIGLQYAYLNSGEDNKTEVDEKASRSEITLDELDDLYRSEEAEKEAELASKRLLMASHSNLVTSIKVNSATPPPVVRMRSKDDIFNGKSAKKINRLSLMSDIGLPDFGGQDLGIDLEKGIFVRKGKKSDNDSNDSGNNSMNTNGSVGSSNSSHSNPRDQNCAERLETHLEAEQSEDENEFIDQDFKGSKRVNQAGKRRSHMGLQITHV